LHPGTGRRQRVGRAGDDLADGCRVTGRLLGTKLAGGGTTGFCAGGHPRANGRLAGTVPGQGDFLRYCNWLGYRAGLPHCYATFGINVWRDLS